MTVEMAKLKAAEVTLVYSMDKVLLLAFRKFCVLLSFRMSFPKEAIIIVGNHKYLFSSFYLEEQIIAKLEVYWLEFVTPAGAVKLCI